MTELSGFERKDLEAVGLEGWLPVSVASTDQGMAPSSPGVYVVFSEHSGPGEFLSTNPAGWHKGRDPTVPSTLLEERWIADAGVLYFGHTMNLRKRLNQLHRFSSGEPVAHYGGRLLWQVSFSDEYVVAWKATSEEDRTTVKKSLIRQFKQKFGRQPFANVQREASRPELHQ